MRKFIKELTVLTIQLLMFYVSPLFAGPKDAMGMVLMILLATLLLSAVLGGVSKEKIKFLYPAVTAVTFIPSVFLFYNNTALIHSVWYLVVSAVGLLIGTALRWVLQK